MEGRVCDKCRKKAWRHKKITATHEAVIVTSRLRRTASAPARLRSLAPLSTLTRSGQRKRKRTAEALLEQIQVPAASLSPAHPHPRDFLASSTRLRTEIRKKLRKLRIPSERRMAAEKERVATEKGTATAAFDGGAYLTDPLRFINTVASKSPHLVIGADTGSGFTKLGITYQGHKTTHFAPLLIYDGGDDWEDLAKFLNPTVPPFVGDSAHFPTLWAFLAFLVKEKNAFLNGDWVFLNNVLGLMCASAKHPCPICIVSSDCFLRKYPYRTVEHTHSRHPVHIPLLLVPSDRIVPLPLHVFLGLSNRLIFHVFPQWFPEANIVQLISTIKTLHTPGCGGLSDLHELNGPEIVKWIKSGCNEKLFASVGGAFSLPVRVRAAFSSCCKWMEQLHSALLRTKDWTVAEIAEWQSTVQHILSNWRKETGQDPFPKVHMLRHSGEFLARHQVLGRLSEAQMESCHAAFNRLFNTIHHNSSHNTTERIRRCLADLALQKVAECVAPDEQENSDPNANSPVMRLHRTNTV
jgi:hypothetical protein